ncbi:hypothetical protein DFH08DRAFT_815157 [Mycena albidolilacea]|uniref:Uncharacterized protein n=1 Tax=Mycena albidolilacea TaxID=1033008 RepID=A0AAD6ZNS6_9AGAR|nr:hypothetical protein DFH08DRAFT_815157 [Mycena albidolilacea]
MSGFEMYLQAAVELSWVEVLEIARGWGLNTRTPLIESPIDVERENRKSNITELVQVHNGSLHTPRAARWENGGRQAEPGVGLSVRGTRPSGTVGNGGGGGHSEDGEWLSFENETLMREEKRRGVDGRRGTKIPEDVPLFREEFQDGEMKVRARRQSADSWVDCRKSDRQTTDRRRPSITQEDAEARRDQSAEVGCRRRMQRALRQGGSGGEGGRAVGTERTSGPDLGWWTWRHKGTEARKLRVPFVVVLLNSEWAQATSPPLIMNLIDRRRSGRRWRWDKVKVGNSQFLDGRVTIVKPGLGREGKGRERKGIEGNKKERNAKRI